MAKKLNPTNYSSPSGRDAADAFFIWSEADGEIRTVTFNAITEGSIPYIDASGDMAENNAALFWDNAGGSLGVGTASPDSILDVAGDVAITDGMTAPGATVGKAKLFVDSDGGDLKVIFGDGTVKTIVTDDA